jgi:rubrerythrin
VLTNKEFIAQLDTENEALFKASAIQVEHFFDGSKSKEVYIDHFEGALINERWNLLEIAQAIADATPATSEEELTLLAKQANDELKHLRLVRQVLEHLTGKEVDLEELTRRWEPRMKDKGASIINKFNGHNDPIALSLYQVIAEGRASACWQQMSESIEDTFISERYAEIAKDEKFHSNIGKWKLEQLLVTEEDRAHAQDLASKMRYESYRISCRGTQEVAEARKLMEETYGFDFTPDLG